MDPACQDHTDNAALLTNKVVKLEDDEGGNKEESRRKGIGDSILT